MKVDFFIVGAPKSGTTSLYHYLNNHPEIEMSAEKEPDYFSYHNLESELIYYKKKRVSTLEKYHSLFSQKKDTLRGEASVSYLFYNDVPDRIKQYNPFAKIIIILRNPVERAFSHYLMDHRLGFVSDSFERIINKESKAKNAHLFYQQYIEIGKYYLQLDRYLNIFNKENVLVIDYEEFTSDIHNTMISLYDFLNVNNPTTSNFNQRYNTSLIAKNKFIQKVYSFRLFRVIGKLLFPKSLIRKILFKNEIKKTMSISVREKLNALFKDDIMALGGLLEKDFTKWIR